MNYRLISRIIGTILICVSVLMIIPLFIAISFDGKNSVLGFLFSIIIGLISGFILRIPKVKNSNYYASEGLATVGLVWIAVPLLGCIPFIIGGFIPSFVDAFFEAVSGFTTTGSTILSNTEALSKSMHYWHCFIHWLGGMGVLAFVLIINPLTEKNGGASMHILRAESPGIKITKLVPRMNQSTLILYLIYFGLTVSELIILWAGSKQFFSSLLVAFSTAGTGGFAIWNDSLTSQSPFTQWVVSIFMFLFGVNFNVYFLILLGRAKEAFKNSELKLYLSISVISTLIIAVNITGMMGSFIESLRIAFFTVNSTMSTTGFCVADFDAWPNIARNTLIILMFTGACAGSTCGGPKMIRFEVMFKAVKRSILKSFNSGRTIVLKSNGERLENDTIESVSMFFLIEFVLLILGTFFITCVENFDVISAFTASLTCINNIGPGFNLVGPTCNFGFTSIPTKLFLSFLMLAGRLEIYPMLVLLCPSLWKK